MVKLNLLERFLNRIHGKTEEDLSTISAFAMDLPPMPLAGGHISSPSSDKHTHHLLPDLPPLISGLDDTLNNDFFYDDEFTVPFDANLTEDSRSLPPGVDSLLRRLLPGNEDDDATAADDNNEEWRRSKMALSKSDSCLYQADQELSDSEREMSMSEHEYSGSSNDSPLQNQSLFSSCGDTPAAAAETSVCIGVSESLTSGGSLSRDSARYNNYDWTPNKQQYVLTFDRSPTKTCSSEEDSCHQTLDTRARITSWSRAKSGRQKRRVEGEQNPGGSPTRGKTEREKKPPTPCLTTWGQLKSQQQQLSPPSSSSGVVGGGLTTWQQVKQTVGRNEDQQMDPGFEGPSSPLERNVTLAVGKGYSGVKLLSPVDETGTTATLVNIYCKMKTQSDEMTEFETNNEAMASPLSLEKLLETWTESLELAGGPERTVDVVYNSSRTDLIPVVVNRASKVPGIIGHPVSGDYASKRVLDNDAKGSCPSRGDGTNNATHSTTTAQQAGSPVLTSSLLRGHDTVDCSIQFPPSSMDRAVQTSFTFSESQMSLMESKAQQTSVIAVAVPNPRTLLDGAAGYSTSAMDSRMVLSAHPLNRPLPDLSFLKKTPNPGARKHDEGESTPKENSSPTRPDPRHSIGKQSTEQEVTHPYGKPLFQCRGSADVKAASSSSDSRDSSPRPVVYRNRSRSSDSTSTYSVCSTSSSGMDPGFYDSSGSGTRTPRMSRIFDDGAKTTVPGTDVQKTPPKPPRLYTASSESHLPAQFVHASKGALRSGSWSEAVGLCTACSCRVSSGNGGEGGLKALASSHPIYFREAPSEADNFKPIEYLQVSPTHARARRIPHDNPTAILSKPHGYTTHQSGLRHGSSRLLQRSKDHVTLRGSLQQNPKPAKSILVRRRQRNQAKHRSWSNPACEMDDLGPRHGYLPSYLLGADRRPLSLPDENLLHQAQSGIEEDHCGPSRPSPPQRWKSQGCVSRDPLEGTVAVGDVVPAGIPEEIEVTQENEKICEGEEECGEDHERFRAKKSVSFSEKIFYHSTSATTSPIDSPRCPQVALLETTTTTPAIRKSVECKTLIDDSKFKVDADVDTEMPPSDFMVSPNLSPSSSLSGSDVTLSTDILHKRELVFDVMRAVEVLVKYFSQTRDPSKKVQLGSTMENGEIGHLVLEHLCPAIHAVVLDGLKPHVNSLFGKVKNSACKVMEDSAELGQPIELIQGLVKSLKSLKFLNTPWLLFNAFIFGLLNYKALDFWLTYVHNHKPLLSRHYSSSSFIHLSNSAAHRLFLDMITSLQPLAQMPFRLEYVFETRMLERRQQDRLAEYLLDRHVSRSVETYIEGQQFLAQLENLSSSQLTLQQDEMLTAAATESKLKRRTKELWQKTQRHLVEKLSASRERLASESTTLMRAAANEGSTLVRSVTRAAVGRKPRPMSLPGTFKDDHLRYVNPPAVVSSVRSLAPLESMELLGGSDASCLVESSSGSESDGGFFLRITKQIRDMHLGDRVYRHGATDYSFEDVSQKATAPTARSDLGKEGATVVGSIGSDAPACQLVAKSDTSRTAANCAVNSQCNSSSDAQPGSLDSNKVQLRNPRPLSNAHLASASLVRPASSTVASALGTRAVDLASGGHLTRNPLPSSLTTLTAPTDSSVLVESVTKKRWSDFGSRLVNIFDRLLLSDTMTTTTTGSASSSPSSVVKCQSMGQINGVEERGGRKRRPLSTSTQFVKAHSLDLPAGNQKRMAKVEAVSQSPRSARALCHYIAADSQQLSFEKGSSLVILQERDPDWKLCRLGESEGLVHSACLRMDDIPQKIASQ